MASPPAWDVGWANKPPPGSSGFWAAIGEVALSSFSSQLVVGFAALVDGVPTAPLSGYSAGSRLQGVQLLAWVDSLDLETKSQRF